MKSKKGWSERVILCLSRTEADPSPSIECETMKSLKPSVKRSLLEDLARELGLDEEKESVGSDEVAVHENPMETKGQNATDQKLCSALSGAASGGNSSDYFEPQSPIHGDSDQENEQDRSSVASNSSVDEMMLRTMILSHVEQTPLFRSQNLLVITLHVLSKMRIPWKNQLWRQNK